MGIRATHRVTDSGSQTTTGEEENCYKEIQSIFQRLSEESASCFQDAKCAIVFRNVYKAVFMAMAKERKGTSSKDIRQGERFDKEDMENEL